MGITCGTGAEETARYKVKWRLENPKKSDCPRYELHPDLLRIVFQDIFSWDLRSPSISGFIEMKILCASTDSIFVLIHGSWLNRGTIGHKLSI